MSLGDLLKTAQQRLKGVGSKDGMSRVDRPEWAEEWEGDWVAERNPALGVTRSQKRAKWMVRGILLSLPFSLFSCVLGLASLTSDSSGEVIVTSSDTSSWVPSGNAQAEAAVAAWLEGSGFVVHRTIPWNASRFEGECGDVGCESHEVRAVFSDETTGRRYSSLVSVRIDPTENRVLVGPAVVGAARNLPGGGQCSAGGTPDRDALDVEQRVEEWVVAWSDDDQPALWDLADHDGPEQLPTLNDWMPGWMYFPGAIAVTEVCKVSDDEYVVLATVGVIPRGCSNCPVLEAEYVLQAKLSGVRWNVQGPVVDPVESA